MGPMLFGMVEGGRSRSRARKAAHRDNRIRLRQGAYYLRHNLETDYEIISIDAMGVGDKAVLDWLPRAQFVDLVPGSFSETSWAGIGTPGANRLIWVRLSHSVHLLPAAST